MDVSDTKRVILHRITLVKGYQMSLLIDFENGCDTKYDIL